MKLKLGLFTCTDVASLLCFPVDIVVVVLVREAMVRQRGKKGLKHFWMTVRKTRECDNGVNI